VTAPILKYPGSKWRIAAWLQRHTPRCDRVIDLYGGSGAYCLNLWYEPRHLVYNDCNQQVVALFRVLRDPQARARLCEAVRFTPWSRAEYMAVTDPKGRIIATGEPVEDARRYLIATWQSCKTNTSTRNGWRHMGGKNKELETSTWQVWRQLPDRIAAVADRLARLELECLPALTLIGRYCDDRTLLYADPPYLRTTIHGTRRRLYQDEMTIADHAALLDALDAHPGPVLLSGYATPLYQVRLAGWRMTTIAARGEGNVQRTECLWLNAACQARLGNGPLFDQEVPL
jgi:DNA adenine methylase